MAVKSYSSPAGVSASVDRPKGSGKKTLSRLTVEPSDNGGFVVEEYYKSGGGEGYMEPTRKVAATVPELDMILDECLGLSAGAKDMGNK